MALSSATLIGGIYSIDFAQPMAEAAPPGPAFAANAPGVDRCMAVPVRRGWPARARALSALAGLQDAHLLSPLAHGPAPLPDGEVGYFVICPAPPGPSLLATLRPWPETELIERFVKPAAQVLALLEARNVTHRSLRPDNLFQSAPGATVTLGCAWAAPPGCHQPAWIEPPYSAACLSCGRGDGTIADDVYALGAVMLMLALGRNPVEGLSDDAVLNLKLEQGSYAALAGSHRLPAGIAELARGMLADDPDHRPSPALLTTPAAARARRIAARPIRRAQRPIGVGAYAASTARTLAYALQREPVAGLAVIRNGLVDRWLRRSLGDALAAGQLDEAVCLRDAQIAAGDPVADPTLMANAIAILDPAAPLVWRSMALWPDGLGAALDQALHHAPDQAAPLAEIVTAGVTGPWASRRDGSKSAAASEIQVRDLGSLRRDQRASVVPWRLSYGLNPLTPCQSPLVARQWVTRLADLLPAMEQAAAGRTPDKAVLLDPHLVAFVATRRDERLHSDLGLLAAGLALDDALAHLQLTARMQAKLHPDPLPNLCAWAVETVQPSLQKFKSRTRRTRIASDLARLAKAGDMPTIAALLGSKAEQAVDKEGYAAAQARLADIKLVTAALSDDEAGISRRARKVGEDISGAVGALACLGSLAWAVFG